MAAKIIQEAQKILDWTIRNLNLAIKCKVTNYRDEKYKVQFLTNENKIVKGVGFNIPEEWVKDTNPIRNHIRGELRSLLRNVEREAIRERSLS